MGSGSAANLFIAKMGARPDESALYVNYSKGIDIFPAAYGHLDIYD